MRGWLIGMLMLAGLAAPVAAAEPPPDLARRAAELVRVLRGDEAPEAFFAPSFLAAVPPAQVKAISGELASRYGQAGAVGALEAKSATAGAVTIDFPRGTVRMELVLDPAAPHLVTGLLVTAVEPKGDRLDALAPAFGALPGHVGLAAAILDGTPPHLVAELSPERPLAVGSAFKLFILAELIREVNAGQRRWSDVVPLGAPSLPSGFLQSWPRGAPVTLHTLAALMISQSDNSAADTLLTTIGREKVENLLATLGVRDAAARDRPFLSTREAFLLKTRDSAFLTRWKSAGEAERRAMLAALAGTSLGEIDLHRFAALPLAIGDVEWFASPADLIRTLDWIRRQGDRTALDILAINPGLPAAKGNFSYLGYKGGSEAGVLAMAFLIRRKDGSWAAAAGAWNDPAAPVEETRFAALMARLLMLIH